MKQIFTHLSCVTSVVLLACATQPSPAENAVNPRLKFEELENEFGCVDHLVSAKAALQAAIPVGTTMATALTTLERAGAHCRAPGQSWQERNCVYKQRITVDDYYPADIVWTVTLLADTAMVKSLTIDRILDQH
jgi:hypothetical protein